VTARAGVIVSVAGSSRRRPSGSSWAPAASLIPEPDSFVIGTIVTCSSPANAPAGIVSAYCDPSAAAADRVPPAVPIVEATAREGSSVGSTVAPWPVRIRTDSITENGLDRTHPCFGSLLSRCRAAHTISR
jgi:hypothetical protein